jgi:hypothetical protein
MRLSRSKKFTLSDICEVGSITIDHVREYWKGSYDEIKKMYGRQSILVKSNIFEKYSLEKIDGRVYLVYKKHDCIINWASVRSRDFDTYGD